MIFVKEKEVCTSCDVHIFTYIECRDFFYLGRKFENVVDYRMFRLDLIKTVFLYVCSNTITLGKYDNRYFQLSCDNFDDYNGLIEILTNEFSNHPIDFSKSLGGCLSILYNTYDAENPMVVDTSFLSNIDTFDKVIDYNWEYFDIDERVRLVKYALGLDYRDDNFNNKIYNEIRDRINMMEINSQIDYDILGSIIKDGATRVYNNLNNDFEKWREEDMIETIYNRRKEAHILTPKIKSIYANEEKRTIIVKWHTGETTKVTCHESDTWDLEKGIMACITKYVLGNNYNAYTMLDKYIKSVKYSDKK